MPLSVATCPEVVEAIYQTWWPTGLRTTYFRSLYPFPMSTAYSSTRATPSRRWSRPRATVQSSTCRRLSAEAARRHRLLDLERCRHRADRAMAVDHGRRVRACRSRHSLTGHGCTLVTRPAMLPGAKAGRQRAAACARCNRSKQLRIPPMQSGRWRQPNLDV
jgi:hypothetical protein